MGTLRCEEEGTWSRLHSVSVAGLSPLSLCQDGLHRSFRCPGPRVALSDRQRYLGSLFADTLLFPASLSFTPLGSLISSQESEPCRGSWDQEWPSSEALPPLPVADIASRSPNSWWLSLQLRPHLALQVVNIPESAGEGSLTITFYVGITHKA